MSSNLAPLRMNDPVEIVYGTETLHFDPVAHRYWIGERELWGSTRYLKEAGYQHAWHGDGQAALFGRYAHEATMLADFGELDEDALDPRLAARVAAWEHFKEVEGFAPDLTWRERPCYHPVYGYGFIPDAPGRWRQDRPCIVEIKSGQREPWHPVQVGGAHRLGLGAHVPALLKADAVLLYLHEDGQYQRERDLVLVTDAQLPALFASIVATVNGRVMFGSRNGRS